MGGGNIWRGRFTDEMNPVNADQMGMLATIINALAVQDAIAAPGREGHRVHRRRKCPALRELYRADTRRSRCHESGDDRAAGRRQRQPLLHHRHRRRAARRGAEGGRGVQGHHRRRRVRLATPRKNPNAKLISEITYQEAIDKDLKVMDPTAFQLCKEQKLPEIRVFNMDNLENILAVAAAKTSAPACTHNGRMYRCLPILNCA